MGKMTVGFAVVVLSVAFVDAGNQGNSLVTCASCQALQLQLHSWKCSVNCEVVRGNNETDVTYGVVANLIDRVQRLEQQNEPKDTLYATSVGAEADEGITISTGVIFKFPNVLVDRLDSYDTATGAHPFKCGTLVDIFTARKRSLGQGIFTIKKASMYSLLIICRSTLETAHLAIYVKKPGETEIAICHNKANPSWTDPSCSVLHQLDAGDEVYVKGGRNGSTLDVKTILQIFFLY